MWWMILFAFVPTASDIHSISKVLLSPMGNYNAKTHALPNNCPPPFSGVIHKNSSAPRPCSVISGQIGNNFAVKKFVIPEKVSRGSFKLSHLLAKSFVENDNPQQVCVGGSVNKRSFKLALVSENSVIDNDIPKESPKLSSILSHVNIEKRVLEAHAKFKDFESRSSGSFKLTRLKLSAGLCMPYNLAVEDDDKDFGCPMSVETREWSSFDEFRTQALTVAGVAFSTH